MEAELCFDDDVDDGSVPVLDPLLLLDELVLDSHENIREQRDSSSISIA